MPDDEEALSRLEADGLLRRDERGDRRTTRRWQSAMARAAVRLLSQAPDGGDDLRVPVAAALVEIYGAAAPDDELARMVMAMVTIEARELDPRARRTRTEDPPPARRP